LAWTASSDALDEAAEVHAPFKKFPEHVGVVAAHTRMMALVSSWYCSHWDARRRTWLSEDPTAHCALSAKVPDLLYDGRDVGGSQRRVGGRGSLISSSKETVLKVAITQGPRQSLAQLWSCRNRRFHGSGAVVRVVRLCIAVVEAAPLLKKVPLVTMYSVSGWSPVAMPRYCCCDNIAATI